MFRGKRVLGVIPARGGSKGIPNKNLQKIGGNSLVQWALGTAHRCPALDRVIVSSDSPAVIRIANRYGHYAPFVRPAELATDSAPSLPVFQHALKWVEAEDECRYDCLVVLEPPCPFRLPQHIEQGLELAVSSGASSVMSLVEVLDQHPVRIKKLGEKGRIEPFCVPEPEGLRRQDQEPAYIRNGAVLIFPREAIEIGRLWGETPYGFPMDRALYGINLDEISDLARARFLYRKLRAEGKLHLIDAAAACPRAASGTT